jgi:hypothetical protein
VFRSFSEARTRGGGVEFRIVWLGSSVFRLVFDPAKNTLTYRDLLPDVRAGSDLHVGIRSFLEELQSRDRPSHRRLDAKRMKVRCIHSGGKVSIQFVILKREYRYGVRRSLEHLQEMFTSFLGVYHPEYMGE